MVRVIVAALVLTVVAPAGAHTQDIPRVGAIRMSYVARASKAGQSALAEIDKFVRQKEAEAVTRTAELDRLRLDVERRGAGPSDRARSDLVKAFEKSRVEFERFQQDARADIEALQLKFDSEFRIKLSPIIDAVSKERGLHFVFGIEQAAIVWRSPAADISDEVVKRLDAGK
ncbi:MAG: OmpH family outer membrane protein [Vicinamibacterales bacterium]